MQKELFIFSKEDKLITILSEKTGLIDTWFKDYENHIPDESFVFNVNNSVRYDQGYSQNESGDNNLTQVAGSFIGTMGKSDVETIENVSPINFIIEENQAAFYDRDNILRMVRIKEIYEDTSTNGSFIKVVCEPSYLELYDHFIEDKRVTNGTAQTALNRALEGSRYTGDVTVSLGNRTDNFYWIDGIEALFKILDTWGGALKDTITLDNNNNITSRKLIIQQRLGADNGLIVEPDYNAEGVSRNTLSYVETALWGQGASLDIEDDEGELTGGNTRYITFEDIEWRVSAGDPVDKPLGQKWVGDPGALQEYGYLHNNERKHRYGHFSNQDYETPEELLYATWQALQERKLKEINHEATIFEDEKSVSLGNTVTVLSREYNKPIELQSQITGLEYDILDDKEINIIVGKYVDMNEDPLQQEVDDLKDAVKRPVIVTDGSYPDVKPDKVTGVTATGAFQTIQIWWDYQSSVYIDNFEVFGSQISDFVPDEQYLLYRGKVSAFGHEVNTDEKWYYYVRAVNTRGTVGEFSDKVSASTIRVITDDILFGSITADLLENNLELADKLAQSTIDRINDGPMEAIETKVSIDEIIGEINVSSETITINGGRIHITGQTEIEDASIGMGAIANLRVDKFHLKEGIIDDAHIDKLTGNKFVAHSIGVDKLNVTELSAITANLGTVVGGHITQQSSGRRLEMFGGEIESYSNDDLSMKFGQYSLDFYNELSDPIGSIGTAFNESDPSKKGMALIVENDFFNLGIRRQGLIRPILRSSLYSNVTTLSGPFNTAITGSSLKLYANRRLVSDETDYEVETTGIDQPTIIMEQGTDTNDMTQYFGGLNRRNNAEWRVRHRVSENNFNNRIVAHADGVEINGEVTGQGQTGAILGPNRESYYENNTGTSMLQDAGSLRANGIRTRAGATHFYLGTLDFGELRISSGRGRDRVLYRDVRASDFINSSSGDYKENIEPLENVALSKINDLEVVTYNLIEGEDPDGTGKEISTLSRKAPKRRTGFISENSPSIATEDGKAVSLYEISSLNTKAIQELYKIMKKHLGVDIDEQ